MSNLLLVTTVRWSSAERLAGSLAQALSGTGMTVQAVFPPGHAIGVSRHLSAGHTYRALSPLRSIRKAIARARPDLVVPCDDRAASLLAELFRSADPVEAALLARSLGDGATYARLPERVHFITEAARAGVPVAAEMIAVEDSAALERGIDNLGLPVVVKIDDSYGGEGVAIARTRAQARAAFARLGKAPSRLRSLIRLIKRRDPHFLHVALRPRKPVVGLQRFVCGNLATSSPATSSMVCWQGAMLAVNHFDAVQTQHENGPATVLTRRASEERDDIARRIARHFRLTGFYGLDFVRDGQDRLHLIEINARATPTSHLALGPGRDLAAALAAVLHQGQTPPPRPAVTDRADIALFPQEWRRAPESPYLATAFHDVPWDDPAVVRALLATLAGRSPGNSPGGRAAEILKFLDFHGLQAGSLAGASVPPPGGPEVPRRALR